MLFYTIILITIFGAKKTKKKAPITFWEYQIIHSY